MKCKGIMDNFADYDLSLECTGEGTADIQMYVLFRQTEFLFYLK